MNTLEISEPNQKKILIAEDNLINQKVLKIMLEKNGLQYDIANDGSEAVSLYSQGEYDLVLMDCQMPIVDGLQASQEIRKHESAVGKQRCAIIALTANAMKGDRERCLSVGMDDFLAKPFKSQDLIELINKWKMK